MRFSRPNASVSAAEIGLIDGHYIENNFTEESGNVSAAEIGLIDGH